ncbi:MAG: GPR endopeptidase [Oscillospiraceae bacterium]|nr:GPR endopeptidase [Oscillospiraceae bacterium]
MIRTDLAAEKEQQLDNADSHIEGISKEEFYKGDLHISRISLTSQNASSLLEKPMGNYTTVTCEKGFDSMPDKVKIYSDTLCNELKRLAGKFRKPLVVGLGNEAITPDSLGVLVSKKIFATRHIKTLAPELYCDKMNEVAVIATGVTGNTGLESQEIVRALCEKIHPDVVFVIDALACAEIKNLGASIQLTDTGISPGSGVENARAELSQNTLGCKVIAVGIPTVIDMQTAVFQISDAENQNEKYASMMVTPRNIDFLVKNGATIIKMALNSLFHPSISPSEIDAIVG